MDIDDIGRAIREGRLAELRERLCELNVVDAALAMQELPTDELLRVFRILPKDSSADVFAYMETDSQERLVRSITDNELEALIDDLFLDDTVDFLEEVPANVVRRVLANSDQETRALINRFLKYPEESAGSIMTIEMVGLYDELTVRQAIAEIRRTGVDKETIYTCYCIEGSRKLIGAVPLHRLLLSDEDTMIRDIMDEDQQLIYVHTLDDQEKVVELARKYDLLSVPVVDQEGRLVGIITIDDIVDVMEEETTEDIELMGGLRPSEDEYLKTSVWTLARNRILWLMILMVSATFTGLIIEKYTSMLVVVTGLIAAIPMLMDTGGNAGSQASTLIIRGLEVGEIRLKDYAVILFKELRVALLCGLALGLVNILRMALFAAANDWKLYLVVSAAMLCAVVVSKIVGCTLPILAKLLRLDPALAATPVVTTVADVLALLIYFSLASLVF